MCHVTDGQARSSCLPCRQRELEEAAALAASAAQGSGSRSGGSVSSRSGKAQRVTFGADDLLAALTWVVVQVRESESCDCWTPLFFQCQASSDGGCPSIELFYVCLLRLFVFFVFFCILSYRLRRSLYRYRYRCLTSNPRKMALKSNC